MIQSSESTIWMLPAAQEVTRSSWTQKDNLENNPENNLENNPEDNLEDNPENNLENRPKSGQSAKLFGTFKKPTYR